MVMTDAGRNQLLSVKISFSCVVQKLECCCTFLFLYFANGKPAKVLAPKHFSKHRPSGVGLTKPLTTSLNPTSKHSSPFEKA